MLISKSFSLLSLTVVAIACICGTESQAQSSPLKEKINAKADSSNEQIVLDVDASVGCTFPPVPANPDPIDGSVTLTVDTGLAWNMAASSSGDRISNIRTTLDAIIARSGILQGPIVVGSQVLNTETDQSVINQNTLTKPEEVSSLLYATDLGVAASSMLNVAVLGSDFTFTLEDIQSKLLATGQFNTVSIINLRVVTPLLSELQAFDAVQVFSDFNYLNSQELGNNMADYVDSDGGVVCMMLEVGSGNGEIANTSRMMQSRWNNDGYYAIPRGGHVAEDRGTLGTVYDANHPIIEGVSTFDGGRFRTFTYDISPGSIRVADWSDGRPLVVTKTIGGKRRADLAFYPSSIGNGWDPATDGAVLMANALTFVSSPADPCYATYDVLFDTNATPTAAVCNDTELPACDPGALASDTTYYWQVIAKNPAGETAGPVWSFTTVADCDLDDTPDATDNCPTVPNADQADADMNGFGDLCDGPNDADHDGDVDGNDASDLAGYLFGPDVVVSQACQDVHDNDLDADVDLVDWAAFQRAFTGAIASPCD